MVRGLRFAPAWGLVLGGVLLFGVTPVRADNIGISARKLVVIDKLEFVNKAAVRLFALDPRITKGIGTSAADIGATLDINIEAFNQPPIIGAYNIPEGFSETAGWHVNNGTIAKYVNPGAPGGPTQVRLAAIGQNKFLKVSARGLGDLPMSLADLYFAPFDVQVRFTVLNGDETITLCTVFHSSSCILPVVGRGSGRKLQCSDGQPVSNCVFPTVP